MSFWDKWTKKKVKKQCEKLYKQTKYIKQLEKKLKKKGK
jgi:hypothetical protein